MANKKSPRTRSPKDTGRKPKKKTSVLVTEKVEYIDYKDVNLLQRFMSDRSKIRGRRVTGNTVQQQRELATAVKNAREMALLPYTKRVASAGRPVRGRRDEEPATDQVAVEPLEDQVEMPGDDAGFEDEEA
jgi:small subunit ribosomal protein S18